MSVDFEAEGLLEGLAGDAREARRQLLERLLDDGFSLEELRRGVAEQRLALLPVDRLLAGDGRLYTAREVAEKAGVPVEFVGRLRSALGLGVPDPDDPVYAEDTIEATRAEQVFGQAGLPEEGRIEVARVIGRAMSDVASAMRELSAEVLVRPGDTELDAAMRLADSTRLTLPQVSPVLMSVLAAHLREQVRQEVVAQTQLDGGGLPGGRPVAVCFADLVDFTRLGESVEPERLGAVARRLVELTSEVAAPPVRIVKMIGDAAMMVCPEPQPLIEAALDLVDRARAEGEEFPELRAGVACGEAVAQGGDWYGRPVNLASRLTAVARPSSVLTSASVKEALEDSYDWSFAGKRRLKGLAEPAATFRVRRAQSAAQS